MSRHPAAVDVAVVGGGVIGLSVAWEARRRGLSVAVFDRGPLGQGASAVAAGMLAPVAEAEFGEAGRRALELGQASMALWREFAERVREHSGIDPGLRRAGTLLVARDRDEAEALERELDYRRRLGLAVQRLLPTQARRLEPALAPTLRLALELGTDHSVDPRALTAGLAVAAQAEGVTLCPGTEVERVVVEEPGPRATGVALPGGERVSSGAVVVAAGAWSESLPGVPADARVPVRPVKGQVLRLRDPSGPGLVERVVRFERTYLVPRGDGRYVLGATVEERGFDTSVTAGAVWELLHETSAIVPGLWELELEELCAGLRPATPDNLPVIGRSDLEGLIWATGHYRNGILLAPVTVDIVMGALGAGEPPAVAASCDPVRFSTTPTAAGAR